MTVHRPIVPPVEAKVWQLRVEDFLLLHEKGSFADYARAELLDGEIWVLNAIHSRHASVQSEIHGRLWNALATLGGDLRTYVTPSVQMDTNSLPEPDIVIAGLHSDGFLPVAKVRLVVEVSDTTLEVDLGRKKHVYANAGIPEYWVVDISARVVHQMWMRKGETFAQRREVAFGDIIRAETVAALVVQTRDL